jgi:hypothetical protein
MSKRRRVQGEETSGGWRAPIDDASEIRASPDLVSWTDQIIAPIRGRMDRRTALMGAVFSLSAKLQ